jgi:hypothetical protein
VAFVGSGIKYAAIAAAASGDNELVAAVAGKKIRVLSLLLVVPSNLVIAFESDASGTALTGDMELGEKKPLVLPFNPEGWFETVAGESLNLELAGATATAGCLSYVEV